MANHLASSMVPVCGTSVAPSTQGETASIVMQLPTVYHLLLAQHQALNDAVYNDPGYPTGSEYPSDRDEKLDDSMFRIFWLIQILISCPGLTRPGLAQQIKSKYALNNLF